MTKQKNNKKKNARLYFCNLFQQKLILLNLISQLPLILRVSQKLFIFVFT